MDGIRCLDNPANSPLHQSIAAVHLSTRLLSESQPRHECRGFAEVILVVVVVVVVVSEEDFSPRVVVGREFSHCMQSLAIPYEPCWAPIHCVDVPPERCQSRANK